MMPDELLQKYLCIQEPISIPEKLKEWLNVIASHRESNKGVLTILITLLLKKKTDPLQDIRNHQDKMPAGFSARTFDTKYVTPFLRANNFPYMASGSGALTRSLEQSVPFDRDYPGAISPKEVKNAFLSTIDSVQSGRVDPEPLMIYLLGELVKYRDRDSKILLPKPTNLSIKDVVEKLHLHFSACQKAAQLPQLAIYAVYIILIQEVKRYRGCELCELQPLQSADRKSRLLGDLQINKGGSPFEVVEIKHNISLTAEIVDDCYQKLRNTQLDTYYLLSTNESLHDPESISKKIIEIYKNHGCQLIVNGVLNTLRYYLRLLSNHNFFLKHYVELIEREGDYSTKMAWNSVCEPTK